MTRHNIQTFLDNGRWRSLYRCVYADSSSPSSFHQSLLAACLASGTGAVASHRAAGYLHKLDGVPQRIVEVAVQRGRRPRNPPFIVHESSDLEPKDIVTVSLIPVTSATRTLIDIGAVIDSASLELAAEDAIRRGLTSTDKLACRLKELSRRGRPGLEPISMYLKMLGDAGTTESGLEVHVARFLRRYRLGDPVRQYVIKDDDGFEARPDFAYVPEKIAVEAHSLKHHTGVLAVRKDNVRDRRLRQLGWEVVYVTKDDLRNRPDEVAAFIRKLLVDRKPQISA